MIVCLVTDRRGADPVAQARAAAAAGIDLIQVRERDLDAAPLAMLVRSVLDAVRGTATRVLVNDRLDVALACSADGVQLRSNSFGVSAARRIAPAGFLVGRSVHDADEAAAAGDADFVVAGTVFPTKSKPNRASYLGEPGLTRIVAAARVPVLAIGGVTLDGIDAVARSGAAGIAAIGLFAPAAPFETLVRTLRTQFDSAKPAP